MDTFHYEEVHVSEMIIQDDKLIYPCPCGDVFELSVEDFKNGTDVAQCPTCSLTIKIVYVDGERDRFLSKVQSEMCVA